MRFKFLSILLFSLFTLSLIWRLSCKPEENTIAAQSVPESKPEFVVLEDSPATQKIDSFFTSRYKRGLFNGNVLFCAHDTIVYQNPFGLANIREKDSLKINSAFQLASVSKTFTSYAIMLLKQQGKLSYSDSLRKFFPEFPYQNISVP